MPKPRTGKRAAETAPAPDFADPQSQQVLDAMSDALADALGEQLAQEDLDESPNDSPSRKAVK